MTERLRAEGAMPLLAFLSQRLAGWSRNTLKQRLQLGCVRVNGATVTRHDHALKPGDSVEVGARAEAPPTSAGPNGLPLLHLDELLVAVNKPAGLLSVATEQQRDRTALALVGEWLSRPGREAKVWPVHRLDRETSGVLLIARTREGKERVQAAWDHTRKVYLAVVEGRPAPAEGVIDQALWEDANLNVHVGEHPASKAARTRYRTLETKPGRSLVEVELETGRRHQIRAHLAWLGHAVVGDPRYGTPGPRMGLHALRLELDHPGDGRRLILEAEAPAALRALLTHAN